MFCPMPFVPQHIGKNVYPTFNSSTNLNKLQLNSTDTSTMNNYLAGLGAKYSQDEEDDEIQVLQHIGKKSTLGSEQYSSILNQPGNGNDDTRQYQRPGRKMKKSGSKLMKQANFKKCKICRETKCTCREVYNRTLVSAVDFFICNQRVTNFLFEDTSGEIETPVTVTECPTHNN
ncbi:hypothetical protein B9Z55_026437 [Caenorhabditis nigoni]|uniref:Uncharacterized protein n=1 Tax=Caenorhabditis nigoni TaxID=1611254 RepID=A0A2G5T389_9PELO|nr:hypothetical protein B9Z55_026437 [Caenorhabditis nigoni]